MTGRFAERFEGLRAELDAELQRCGRTPGSVTIVGVAKRQPADTVRTAIAAGLTDVAENYLQEARAKFEAVNPAPRLAKHFIGHVQTNKAAAIAGLFDVVQSVDRIEAARALARGASKAGKRLRVLLQVNVSPNDRFGCPPSGAEALARAIRDEPDLNLEGIMAIGPLSATPGQSKEIEAAFSIAAMTLGRVGGSTLSIGMSDDWREAVRAGSTMIRIGTALFGERPSTGSG